MEPRFLSSIKLGCFSMLALGISACASLDRADDPAGTPPAERGNTDPRMLQMQARMLEMHNLMHRIENARDSEERQRLRQEQAQLLQENIRLIMPLMMSIIHQGASPGGGDASPGQDPCRDLEGSKGGSGGDTGGQGGGIILMPVPEQNAPGPAPLPEEPILEDAPQRSSAVLR